MYSAYSHQQLGMVELLRSRGGLVTPDIAAIYRQTDLAREMLTDAVDKTVAEELLRFGADGGATEIVSLALSHVDWPRDDSRWFKILSSPLSFWHQIPWLYPGNEAFDRAGYLACFRLILASCDVNVVDGPDATFCTK